MKHAREFLALATAKWPPYGRGAHSLFVHPDTGRLALLVFRGGDGIPDGRRCLEFTFEDADLSREPENIVAELDVMMRRLDEAAANVVSLPTPGAPTDGPDEAA